MLKRILAVLTALVILAAAAGSASAESAETVSPGGLTLRDIESLNGGPISIHENNVFSVFREINGLFVIPPGFS